jgi:Cu(I)/Ag(I) efflux system periplasmic protein CusF
MKKVATIAFVLCTALLAATAQTEQMKDMNMESDSAAQTHQASGTVTRIDPQRGTLTISHGPVPSLKWPPMTMPFLVKDKKFLENVKRGQKIDFTFVKAEKDYVVMDIKQAN